ncbi:hypothetical protein FHG87_000692 [Trinorchestia longiramus]|nr:hypothetical protein FHG87_000692 [Trinorchestia longiramus]
MAERSACPRSSTCDMSCWSTPHTHTRTHPCSRTFVREAVRSSYCDLMNELGLDGDGFQWIREVCANYGNFSFGLLADRAPLTWGPRKNKKSKMAATPRTIELVRTGVSKIKQCCDRTTCFQTRVSHDLFFGESKAHANAFHSKDVPARNFCTLEYLPIKRHLTKPACENKNGCTTIFYWMDLLWIPTQGLFEFHSQQFRKRMLNFMSLIYTSVSPSGPYRPPGGARKCKGAVGGYALNVGRILLYNIQ